MIGDLPLSKIDEILKEPGRMEYFQDAKTFVYNEQTDKVEYKRTYDHIAPERFLKVNRGSLDGDLLASLTTWTP